MNQSIEPRFIDTPAELEKFCEQLRPATVIALDTEFIRIKTYYARLCLIQIASEDVMACIDPLAIEDLTPLLDILYDPAKLKVFHAARQDLEIFFDRWKKLPQPVFDTQIACAVLGYPDQMGYANLVENFLHISIDKSHARTDWSQRPLSAKQLSYAMDDARYLLQIYPMVVDRLRELNRLEWLDEDFQQLVNPALYDKDPASSWQRVGGHGRLKARQLAILRELATWRETEARRRDKPRKWILSDDILLSLARLTPENLDELAKIHEMPGGVVKNSGAQILELIKKAQALPESEWPSPPAKFRPSADEESLSDLLMTWLKILASKNNISPASLANRKEIDRLARGERDLSVLRGWRGHLVGQPLLDLIEGRVCLQVIEGRVTARDSKAG